MTNESNISGFDYRQPLIDGSDTRGFSFVWDHAAGVGLDIERWGANINTIHGAVFLGFVALKAGVATVEEILGDCGLVHDLVHIAMGDDVTVDGNIHDLAEFADELYRRLRRVGTAKIAESLGASGADLFLRLSGDPDDGGST